MNPNEKLGDKKFKAAQENITTGIFQWSKDYSSGASNFSEARTSKHIKSNTINHRIAMKKPWRPWKNW